MSGRLAARCAAATAMLVVGGAQAEAPRYEVRPVDGLPECATVNPQALDERGQVVGGRCLWNPSGTLAPPDADHPEVFSGSISQGVAAGHAFGESLLDVPVIWENGQPRLLPLAAGFTQGLGLFVNAHRDVLGQMSSETAGTQLTLWPAAGNPLVITLSPPAGNRDLRDLNDLRQVVGCASFRGVFDGHIVPFEWADGQTRILEPSSWSDPAGCAYAINDAGVAAGESASRPVLWRNGVLQRLAPAGLTGRTTDINNQGAAIGVLNGRDFYTDGANVWDLFGLIDDQSLVPSLGRIIAINDQGQILASRPGPGAPFAGVALLEPKRPRSTGDPVPPVVTMTSPWNGEPLVDLVTLEAKASDNVAVAGVQFFANGLPVGPEDTSAPYRAEADAIDVSAVPFYARARDTAGNFTSTPVRFATVTRDCRGPAAGQSLTGSIETRTGVFTIRFTASTTSLTESGFALASGTPGGFAATSAAVLFALDGQIKVRNGAAYASTGVSYRLNVPHHFRMAVDVPGNRYSVWLKFANESEQPIAAGQAFRGSPVTRLDHWLVRTDQASPAGAGYGICNIRL
jgi:hypothetical protein